MNLPTFNVMLDLTQLKSFPLFARVIKSRDLAIFAVLHVYGLHTSYLHTRNQNAVI